MSEMECRLQISATVFVAIEPDADGKVTNSNNKWLIGIIMIIKSCLWAAFLIDKKPLIIGQKRFDSVPAAYYKMAGALQIAD
jgi:hypothetical protein